MQGSSFVPKWPLRPVFGLPVVIATVASVITACAGGAPPAAAPSRLIPAAARLPLHFHPGPIRGPGSAGLRKIKHVVIITQENRSFDSYFGTYPGADGLSQAGNVCLPYPGHACVRPYHTRADLSGGGPHGAAAATADVDDGSMDGFVEQSDEARHQCVQVDTPACAFSSARAVMGYYDYREIPNYWTYAHDFVLADHFFEATNSWSFPQHLYMISGWSATCPTHDPMSCTTSTSLYGRLHSTKYIYAWTDLTYLLHAAGVSWRYYIESGRQPDCDNSNSIICPTKQQSAKTPSYWNPLPEFDTVQQDKQTGDVQDVARFFTAAQKGSLPAVSWVVPNNYHSEHPPSLVSDGMAWTTRLVNAIMRGPDWNSTAIFINWDDWGGFYDNVPPVDVDGAGYGLRVPALVISPYAKTGYVDHQTLSTDAYLKFIEDRWLDGERLDPQTDGRPDARPDVREDAAQLGNLLEDFNFERAPRRPVLLPTHPKTDLTEPPQSTVATNPAIPLTRPPTSR